MSDDKKPTQPRKFKVRASHIIFLILAVAATLALAWWQWTRFRSGSGTFQNLGYAMQWPLFGAFFVFAYRKYVEYENEMLEAQANSEEPSELHEASDAKRDRDSEKLLEDFLPARPTMDVDTYNQQITETFRRGHLDDR